MNNPAIERAKDDVKLGELFRPLSGRGRQILRGSIIATLLCVLGGGAYLFMQPATRSASLEFRPVFEGARSGTYPNGTPFAPSDIVAPSVVDQVFVKNRLQEYCPSDAFRSGLFVQAGSPSLRFLNLEYQARLSDARLTPIDRRRLEAEYEDRRATVQTQYELMFVQSPQCVRIPQPIVHKSLGEVLESWAAESQEKRGVMKLRVAILSPGVFDQPEVSSENLLVRADLLRTGVARVIANIIEVEALPGAELVRGSDKNISLREVRAELEDLIQARLDPLVAQAGAGLGREARRWVGQALQTSTIRLQAAQQRAEAYRTALREYSGTTPAGSVRPQGEQRNSSDVQTLTPQIDRTFIDRIVELSSVNTTFRQEITRKAIEASVDAVNRGAIVEQYRQLSSTTSDAGYESIPREVVSKTLAQVATQAKEATRRFNEICEEYSRVALRYGPAMYRVERPAESSVIRTFGRRDFVMLVLAVMFITPIILTLAVLLQYHVRRFVVSLR